MYVKRATSSEAHKRKVISTYNSFFVCKYISRLELHVAQFERGKQTSYYRSFTEANST